MPSQSDPNPMSTTTHTSLTPTDASGPTLVKLGLPEPAQSWSEDKRHAFAAGIAAKLGCPVSAHHNYGHRRLTIGSENITKLQKIPFFCARDTKVLAKLKP